MERTKKVPLIVQNGGQHAREERRSRRRRKRCPVRLRETEKARSNDQKRKFSQLHFFLFISLSPPFFFLFYVLFPVVCCLFFHIAADVAAAAAAFGFRSFRFLCAFSRCPVAVAMDPPSFSGFAYRNVGDFRSIRLQHAVEKERGPFGGLGCQSERASCCARSASASRLALSLSLCSTFSRLLARSLAKLSRSLPLSPCCIFISSFSFSSSSPSSAFLFVCKCMHVCVCMWCAFFCSCIVFFC